ncbi:uncharacterized protein LOC128897080 [Hylaeus anthracinus]|uniref:uncharacterized protein LOC128897080 n=1 Tax=Hylaeus anthracinus TaxID=313031 RepID=UPI0023BA2D7E|nr:uncharacterized protein LOC128897080 [Hylaeus anthracinus]
MDDTKEIMSDIYNTLVQIRYPKITTAIGEDVQATVLSGENRITLLSWLLTEKSPKVANTLENLKGAALEAKLSKYYSEIGICTNRNIVLGKCTLREQLPFLRLLLEFIKCVHVAEPSNNEDNVLYKSVEDMIQDCILENPGDESKLIRSESLLDLNLKEYTTNLKSNSNYEIKKGECVGNETMEKEDDKGDEKENDINLLFNAEREKFIEAFSTIESWPMFKEINEKNQKNTMTSMDDDIKDICSNFSTLTQFLQTKEEIYNANIPKQLSQINTPLNKIIKDVVVDIEEAVYACSNSH